MTDRQTSDTTGRYSISNTRNKFYVTSVMVDGSTGAHASVCPSICPALNGI